eukprot:TRINITY_DN11790_c0_g1_i1.p1 TRINITY_DN11790_c0_g1~~TRINITY_DN11790_c0_g1_i1.p1  ORF type:complete len:372 (+),score=69.52 TRINITY_DN11790_c0_g1_i1:170-1285(+)
MCIRDRNNDDASGICTKCKFGTTMLEQDRSQYCKCNKGDYKKRIVDGDNVSYECTKLGDPIALDRDEMYGQTLQQLVDNAYLVYGFQKIATYYQQYVLNDKNEIILLEVLTRKIAEAISINKDNLEQILDVFEVINISNSGKELLIIDNYKLVSEKIGFDTIEEYEDLISVAIKQQQEMSAANQKKIEEEVISFFFDKFIDFQRFNLDNIISLSLSTGTLQISKIENTKEFDGVTLDYTEVLSEVFTLENGNIYTYVLKNRKDQFKKDGVETTLLANPITITNYKQIDGEASITQFAQTTTKEFKICFDQMSQLENAVCMYWDISTLRWSTEGIRLSLIHISEPTRQAEISYAVFCLKKKKNKKTSKQQKQ